MTGEEEVALKDGVPSKSEEEDKKADRSMDKADDRKQSDEVIIAKDDASQEAEDDDNNDDNIRTDKKKEDPLMNASDVIQSVRTAIEEKFKNIEPPMPAFRRPMQRQHWDDVQEAPHKEWGDIFFDLFYVAGAYNLGNLIREEPTRRGLFYFCACFFPLQNLWQHKMYWDARFYTPTRDMYHAFYELCTLVVLATAVLNIRPVSLLSNPEEHIDLFVFCLSITLGMLLVMGRSLEVMVWIDNEPAAIMASKRDACMYGVMTVFSAAATIHAGVQYFGSHHDESAVYGESNTYDSGYDYNTTTNSSSYVAEEENHHLLFRFLAGTSSYGGEKGDNNHTGDVAMGILLGGFCANHLLWFLTMIYIVPRLGGGDFKLVSVPMNVDYSIHRYGEWTMLMLGETVLSLLIVGTLKSSEFYKTFFCGIITISLLQILHFRSQPHHADDHAIRRKKERGYVFVVLVQLYSAALIILGASYKMILYEFVYEANYAKEAGYLSDYYDSVYDAGDYGSDYDGYDNATTYKEEHDYDDGHKRLLLFGSKLHRRLAGGGGGALNFHKDDRIQRVATLFCGSMAAVWLLLDLLIIIHRGIAEQMQKCKENPKSTLVKLLGIPLLLIRIGLIAFMATLSQYVTDLPTLAFVGLVGVLVQVALRVVGTALYREETEEDALLHEILRHGIEGEKSMAFQAEEEDDD